MKPRESDRPTMQAVYDGQRLLGFVLRRYWVNGLAIAYEAFDGNEQSLGIFGSQSEAADALSETNDG